MSDPNAKKEVQEQKVTSVSKSETVVPKSHSKAGNPWRWPVAFMFLGLLAFAAYLVTINKASGLLGFGSNQADKIKESISQAAETFATEQISQTFLSQLPNRISQGGDKLEVASYQSVESFRSESQKRIAWDFIDLGTTVMEVRAPVTYRYHVLLSDEWNLEIHNNICFVTAPKIRATLPPAIHTDGMEKYSSRGWGRFDSKESMEALQRSMTPTVMEFAGDKKHISLVKDTARKGIAIFVRNWLLDQEYWDTNKINKIIVSFNDEITSESDSTNLIPISEQMIID